MKRFSAVLSVIAVATLAIALNPAPEAAPAFSLTNAEGKTVSLDQFKGKYVVLEWWNNGCPVVGRHYRSGNIPKLQAEMKAKDVVWVSIVSSAPGKQGHVDTTNARSTMEKNKGVPSEILLDPTGAVGKLYEAKTTPQMVLISPKGELLYNGAIDSNRTGNQAPEEVVNYLTRAHEEAVAGKPISTPRTQPYGCAVKYGS